MAVAMANKTLDLTKPPRISGPWTGKTINHEITYWNSQFSDGTPLDLITSNYGKDPVNNIVVDDHLNLLKIK